MENRYFSTFYQDQYINNHFDTPIFNELSGYSKGLFEPQFFFNLLKTQFDFVCQNGDNPTLCRDHLLDIGLNKSQLLFFLGKLQLLIELFIKHGIATLSEMDKLRNCLYLISEELDKLNNELNPKLLSEESVKEISEGVVLEHTYTEAKEIDIRPKFSSIAIEQLFPILKDFFSLEDQSELKFILETGNNAKQKLLFNDNGNRLSDTFKKLYEYDLIIGLQKKDLQNWIISNFNYLHRHEVKEYTPDTIEKAISRNYYPCKSPLIEIIKGQIQKVHHPRLKKT